MDYILGVKESAVGRRNKVKMKGLCEQKKKRENV